VSGYDPERDDDREDQQDVEQAIDGIIARAEDGQVAEAIASLDEVLAELNDAPRLHALRAFLLVEVDRVAEAQRSVDLAYALDEEDPYVLHAVGRVALAAGEPDRAIAAARQAYALDPADHAAIILEARARAMLGQWDEVMSRADYVLTEQPDNAEAAFLRIAAIESRTRGGKKLDAAEWDQLAARFPHIAIARTGRAWTLLHRGRATQAEAEFRDALALDPSDPWAREGLVMALKARYPGYTLLLRFFFWLQSLEPRTQLFVLIGGVIGSRMLRRVAEAQPSLAIVVWPVIIAYFAFVLLTWLADPLLNLALMAKDEGRRLLSEDDRKGATAVGAALAVGLLLAAIGGLTPWKHALLGGMAIGFTSLTLAAAYHCAPGKYRDRLLGASAVFIVCGVGAMVSPDGLRGLLLAVAIFGVVISTWVSRMFIRKSHGG
jgi:tetratricopeptide (TPR) repeat protein